MAFEESLRSIGGLKRGPVPLCRRPEFSVRWGSADMTSNNSSFTFRPADSLVELGNYSAPIMLSQTWCEDHAGTNTPTWQAGGEWTDLMIFEMKSQSAPETKFGLCIQIGIAWLNQTNGTLTAGARALIKNLDTDTVIKMLPTSNNSQGGNQTNWFGTPAGLIVCPQVVNYSGVNYLTFAIAFNNNRNNPNIYQILSGMSLNIDDISVWCPAGYTPTWVTDDPNDDDEGEDNEDEGGGSHIRHWDPVPYPSLPTIGISAGGFVTPYCLTPAEMGNFGAQCFDPDVWTAIRNYFEQPQDFVAGCMIVPFTPPASIMYKPKFGAFLWPTPYARLDSDFYEVDCGEITIDGYYGSAFDYSPYTKLSLWLPYIGYQELNPDEFTGDSLHVKYHIDCITGACIAIVSTGVVGPMGPQQMQVLAQFTGNCGVQVPTSRSGFDGAVANAINILTTMASLAAGAGAGAAIEENMAAQGTAQAARGAENHMLNRQAGQASQLVGAGMSSVSTMKPNVVRNGTPGSTSGYMGVQKPYLIKEAPRQVRPSNYRHLKGYPAFIGGTLSGFNGYAEVCDIQLNNIPATVDEIEEIYELLKGGILL